MYHWMVCLSCLVVSSSCRLVTWMLVSSYISLFSASCGVSFGFTFPPGMCH